MEELKKLYFAPKAQILCFKPVERLAAYGEGIINKDEDVAITGGASGQGNEDYE